MTDPKKSISPDKPLYGAILVGGKNLRMGRPKWALPWRGGTLLDHTIALLEPFVEKTVLAGETGAESPPAPEVSDAPGVEGPMAGVLGVMRWAPERSWLILACDMPLTTAEGLQWLIGQRTPDAWAVLPVVEGKTQPLGAIYEPRARTLLEERVGRGERFSLREALVHPKVLHPAVPERFASLWTSCNTPGEWREIQ